VNINNCAWRATANLSFSGSNVTVSIMGDLKSDITTGTTRRNTIGQIVNGKEQILNTMTIDVCNSLTVVSQHYLSRIVSVVSH